MLPKASLSELLPLPAERWLRRAGATVHLSRRVERLQARWGSWQLDGEAFDAVVLACDVGAAKRLLAASSGLSVAAPVLKTILEAVEERMIGEAFRQENLTTGVDRELVSAEARHESDDATESFGVRRVVDDLTATAGPQSGEKLSELVSVGGSRDLANDRITLRALTEQAVNHRDESLDFPERTTLGVDYHFNAATTFFGSE